MQNIPARKNKWSQKIETKADAEKVIKDASYAYFFVATLQIVAGFFLGAGTIIDGVIYLVLAFLLRQFYSRAVAIALLILSLAAVVVTAMNIVAQGGGGSNNILAVIMVYVGARSVQATFLFPKLK